MPYDAAKGKFLMKETPWRNFVSCMLLESGREKDCQLQTFWDLPALGAKCVCVWGVGEIKPPSRVYCRSDTKKTTVGLKWATWTEVWFVTGSALCYWTNCSFFDHLRCFLCLHLPGCLHVPCWKPYEFHLLYILLSRRYLGCFRRAK